MSYIDRVFEKISRLKAENRITDSDAKNLKDFVRSLETNRGEFGQDKKNRIEEKIDRVVQRNAKKSTGNSSNTSGTNTSTTGPNTPVIPGNDDEDKTPIKPAKPTKKDRPKPIPIPPPNKRANYTIPEKSDDRIQMPNLNKKITEEINRVTLRLIKTTKEFIESGQTFSGIDYIAENEILDENGNPYYVLPDFNSPGSLSAGSSARIKDIKDTIDRILDQRKKYLDVKKKELNSGYNYARYLRLFDLRYNGVGDPSFRFTLDLSGITQDLTILLVEEDPDIT